MNEYGVRILSDVTKNTLRIELDLSKSDLVLQLSAIRKHFCKMILDMKETQAGLIVEAKRIGLWDDNVKEFHCAVLEAEGDQAKAMYTAKRYGIWNDGIFPYELVLPRVKGDVAWYIRLSCHNSYWDDEIADATTAIINAGGNNSLAMYGMYVDDHWNTTYNYEATLFSSCDSPSFERAVMYSIANGYISKASFMKFKLNRFLKSIVNRLSLMLDGDSK